MVDISWLSLIMVVNTPETEIHEPYENKTEKKKKNNNNNNNIAYEETKAWYKCP